MKVSRPSSVLHEMQESNKFLHTRGIPSVLEVAVVLLPVSNNSKSTLFATKSTLSRNSSHLLIPDCGEIKINNQQIESVYGGISHKFYHVCTKNRFMDPALATGNSKKSRMECNVSHQHDFYIHYSV